MATTEDLVLGFDLSTQSLTVTALQIPSLNYYKTLSLNFDLTLPLYKTHGGVHKAEDGVTVTSPTIMWIEAIDTLFQRLKEENFPFKNVKGLSASGQQHGSVYWAKGSRKVLDELSHEKTLKEQLGDAFSIANSPVWMDSSTSQYCREIEDLMGGASVVASKTGSKAFERFTVSQIAKVSKTQPKEYESTERISLVSSFFVSLFLEHQYANIDASDGSGMNVMEIFTKQWIPEILNYAGSDLASKLGSVSPSHTVIGSVSSYFQKRYGFSSDCKVIAAAGDNPCSLAGLKLRVGDVAISLGTSATVMGPLINPVPSPDEGNIMCNPVDPNGFMALLCYKNSALTRQHIRDLYMDKSWEKFNEALSSTPPGNNGHIGFYFQETEIIPHKKGFFYFNPDNSRTTAWDDGKIHVRAIVESQALSMLVHSNNIGMKASHKISVTGGASANTGILEVLSNVFGVPIYVGEQPNSASLGAAYRTYHGLKCAEGKFVPFEEVVGSTNFKLAVEPNMDLHKMYLEMAKRYKSLEEEVLKLN